MKRLEGKVAVITGGAGGIGAATGRLFAEEGASVLLVDLAEQALQQAVQAIGGERVSAVVADVTQAEQVQRYVQTAIERYGGIDVFFANAGVEGVVAPISEYPDDVFDRVMAVNVRGVWLGLKHVMAHMQQRGGGSIIITSRSPACAAAHGHPAQIETLMMRDRRVDPRRRGGRAVEGAGLESGPGTSGHSSTSACRHI